ncbi:MAG: hypothetical protein ACE5HS_06020 [bacterium]
MRKRTYLILIIAPLFMFSRLPAQDYAGQAGEFLRWGVGAKALGMGRAFTSISDDASALYWNPAGLSALSRIGGSFMFMHIPLQEGASFNYLAGAVPLRLFFINASSQNAFVNFIQDFNIGAGLLWHSLGEFEIYNKDTSQPLDQSENTVSQSAIYFSVSYPLTRLFKQVAPTGILKYLRGDINMGVTAKFIQQDVFGANGSASSFDLGVKYTHNSGIFNLGLTLRDLTGSSISYGAKAVSDPIPATGVLGLSILPHVGILRGLLLSMDYGFQRPPGRDRDVMFGLEYDLSVISSHVPLKLRLGANSNYESFTIGVNISPEIMLGRDWVPSGDVTYGKERSAYDAVGSRYSISVDHNPFTARYWYLKGMSEFTSTECENLPTFSDNLKLIQYLKNAERAKNPDKRAFRYEATLRRADMEFLHAISVLRNAKSAEIMNPVNAIKKFKKTKILYTADASKSLFEDYTKSEYDRQAYFKSFVYYVQSLILTGDYLQAMNLCKNYGQSWGKRINVIEDLAGTKLAAREEVVDYLQAFALFRNHNTAEARNLIHEKLNQKSLARFFSAHMAFVENNFQEVLTELKEIDLNDTYFPESVFLPLTSDCLFGDEVLFLKAITLYKTAEQSSANDYLAEFAKIPRFFPDSDLARFLTKGEATLYELIDFFESHNTAQLDHLLGRLINSYTKTISDGALKEETYTFNY